MASKPEDNQTEVINLLLWHRGLHLVTGSMALKFNRATPADLTEWAKVLKVIAAEMEAATDRGNHGRRDLLFDEKSCA
jgi:hypothetical protein